MQPSSQLCSACGFHWWPFAFCSRPWSKRFVLVGFAPQRLWHLVSAHIDTGSNSPSSCLAMSTVYLPAFSLLATYWLWAIAESPLPPPTPCCTLQAYARSFYAARHRCPSLRRRGLVAKLGHRMAKRACPSLLAHLAGQSLVAFGVGQLSASLAAVILCLEGVGAMTVGALFTRKLEMPGTWAPLHSSSRHCLSATRCRQLSLCQKTFTEFGDGHASVRFCRCRSHSMPWNRHHQL